jgi:peroxiredoxin family protein
MKTLERLAIVVREDAYDRILTPLTFAWLEARRGTQVDMLFTLWSVRLLAANTEPPAALSAGHAHESEWLRQRLERDGDPTDPRAFLRALKDTGNVGIYGCKYAAMTFDVDDEAVAQTAEGIVDPGWFLREKCLQADHCQYF